MTNRLETVRRDTKRVERLRRRWREDEALFEALGERERVACEVACDALGGVPLRTLVAQMGLQSVGQAHRMVWEGVALLERGQERGAREVLRDIDRALGGLRGLVQELGRLVE